MLDLFIYKMNTVPFAFSFVVFVVEGYFRTTADEACSHSRYFVKKVKGK